MVPTSVVLGAWRVVLCPFCGNGTCSCGIGGAGASEDFGLTTQESFSEPPPRQPGRATPDILARAAILDLIDLGVLWPGQADKDLADRFPVYVARRSGVAGDAHAEGRAEALPNVFGHLARHRLRHRTVRPQRVLQNAKQVA